MKKLSSKRRPAAPAPARRYHSTVRREQADATRQRILDAARTLFLARGYEATTIEGIAKEAGVATPTVYAAFASKRGIAGGLLDRARFGERYAELVHAARTATTPGKRLHAAAAIARQIYDAERAEIEILSGAGGISAELAAMDRKREAVRYDAQALLVGAIAASGTLRDDVDAEAARDILWTLTNRDTYRMLTIDRGWPSARYQAWLGDLLVAALLRPAPTAARAKT